MHSMQVPQKSAPNLSFPEEVETPLILVKQESDPTQKSKSTTVRLRLGGPYHKIYVLVKRRVDGENKIGAGTFPPGLEVEALRSMASSMPLSRACGFQNRQCLLIKKLKAKTKEMSHTPLLESNRECRPHPRHLGAASD